MRRLLTITKLILLLLVFSSCQSDVNHIEGTNTSTIGQFNNEQTEENVKPEPEQAAHFKKIDGISYTYDLISAIDFLKRKGEQPDAADLESLKRESVLILEISTGENILSIFDSPRMTMDQEESVQYLLGQINSDLVLYQGEQEFSPSGSLPDALQVGTNSIRTFFFFTDVNSEESAEIKYYDRLFDNGFIHIKI